MTMDKSLRIRRGLLRSRSVLTRAERLTRLQEAERWKEGDSPLGLPKVRVYKLTMKKKKKKKEEGEEGAEGAAAPAAGGKKPDAKAAANIWRPNPASKVATRHATRPSGGQRCVIRRLWYSAVVRCLPSRTTWEDCLRQVS